MTGLRDDIVDFPWHLTSGKDSVIVVIAQAATLAALHEHVCRLGSGLGAGLLLTEGSCFENTQHFV